ncbi:MAG TPA: TOBE domain-containing protein, partial [Desulfobacterales bacterium]|nr:TOBE domain-containing protein [Desulfobacterales bacterium]
GRLQQVGAPTEVYDHPANLFVASFIGSPTMNLLPCVLLSDGGNGKPALRGAEGVWQLPIATKIRERIRQGTKEEELIMGIRPEDIALSPEAGPEAIKAEVYAVEPLGDRNIFDLRLGESIVKVKTAPTFLLEMGTKVWMTVNQDRMHIFERKSEKAIF